MSTSKSKIHNIISTLKKKFDIPMLVKNGILLDDAWGIISFLIQHTNVGKVFYVHLPMLENERAIPILEKMMTNIGNICCVDTRHNQRE